MTTPATIQELAREWVELLASLTAENNEEVACKMVGIFAGNDYLWDEWYASGKEPNVQAVFDNVADLEVPDGHLVKDAADRKKRWKIVKDSVTVLEKKYLRS